MAKDKLTDYDSTASNNLDVGGISVAEGMLPSGVNNAIRELMSHQADAFGAGTPLYVDQTNNRLGVGTASPSVELEIASSAPQMRITDTDTNAVFQINASSTTGGVELQADATNVGSNPFMALDVGGSEAMRIDSSGNVGINTTSPATILHTKANSNTETDWVFTAQNSAGSAVAEIGGYGYNHNLYHRFWINDSEKVRITNGGIVLVGKTSTTNSVAGIELNNTGQLVATFASGTHILGRNSTDGSILQFDKDGTTVGAIGSSSGTYLYIGSDLSGSNPSFLRFVPSSIPSVRPASATGSNNDNSIDLGSTSARFDDVYATNGTIQTSDANEKQQIAALTDAEITAAKAISQLFKTFKWNDKVAEKGDAARTHTGVIAQDVEAAMTAAGLDAGNYAFFISSTWWETQTEVPAVEAVEAVLDDDGNVVTEAIEAQEAYTRTDTYETAEEAPEGAVERTRLGIRYPELLAFVGAATEQRLANIETRLAALEAN